MTTETLPEARTKRPFSTRPKSPRFRAVVPLPSEWLACRLCGAATPPGEQHGVETIRSEGRMPVGAETMLRATRDGVGESFETPLTRCPVCAEIRAEAERLAAESPGLGVDFGIRGAVEVVERALIAAAAVGQPARIGSTRDLRLAVAHLSQLGGVIRWASRFEGLAERAADPRTGAATPFAHVDEAQLGRLRTAFAAYLRARVERPIPIVPREAVACLLCGVGQVLGLPSRAAEIWRPMRVKASAIGGRGNEKISGELCPACAAEADVVGIVGATAIEHLVLRAAGVERRPAAFGVTFRATPAWAVSGQKTPNARPWAHLDLAQLRVDVESGRR